jgi:hypothetical protein
LDGLSFRLKLVSGVEVEAGIDDKDIVDTINTS